jgi:hypothetical protein
MFIDGAIRRTEMDIYELLLSQFSKTKRYQSCNGADPFSAARMKRLRTSSARIHPIRSNSGLSKAASNRSRHFVTSQFFAGMMKPCFLSVAISGEIRRAAICLRRAYKV